MLIKLKTSYFPRSSPWIFFLALIVISIVYNYQTILFRPPGVIHQWRQCDCLSLAATYFSFDANFFSPGVFYLGGPGTGMVASEFPIIYYFVAQLWKLFGQHEIIFRLITLFVVFAGLFYLFRMLEEILNDSIWAITLTLFLFTSPILAYYGNSFLMDPYGLSFALIGWYMFAKYYTSSKKHYFYLASLFFLFAGLLKISSLISFFALFLLCVLELLGLQLRKDKPVFTQPLMQLVVFVSTFLIIASWYMYANSYNNLNGLGVFLIGIMPIWDYASNDIYARIEHFSGAITMHQFLNIEALWMVFTLFFLQFAFLKNANRFFLFTSLLLFFAVLLFLVLWFGAITEEHDYYMTNLLVFVVFSLLSFFVALKNTFPSAFVSTWLRTIFVILLIYNIQLTSKKTAVRYFNTADENYPSCYSENEIGVLKWTKFDFSMHKEALIHCHSYFQSIGIKPDDKVISLPDISFNISLYLMNQRGWTQGASFEPLSITWFTDKIRMGARYLIINDDQICNDPVIKLFTNHKIGSYKNIDVYKLY